MQVLKVYSIESLVSDDYNGVASITIGIIVSTYRRRLIEIMVSTWKG